MESRRLRLRPGLCDMGHAELLWRPYSLSRQPCIPLKAVSCRVPTVPEGCYWTFPRGCGCALQLSCHVPGTEAESGWPALRDAGKYIRSDL